MRPSREKKRKREQRDLPSPTQHSRNGKPSPIAQTGNLPNRQDALTQSRLVPARASRIGNATDGLCCLRTQGGRAVRRPEEPTGTNRGSDSDSDSDSQNDRQTDRQTDGQKIQNSNQIPVRPTAPGVPVPIRVRPPTRPIYQALRSPLRQVGSLRIVGAGDDDERESRLVMLRIQPGLTGHYRVGFFPNPRLAVINSNLGRIRTTRYPRLGHVRRPATPDRADSEDS
ncbi:hypothetical protein BO71DRAFT_108300 [Aspergillus ellipticus CBS 707.79]|uniref:Uncharacterized protein n=1 Tax=Aspergillus ellipticus CBS 707.79 TaxID=1448320 RepID=A0A319DMZ2_9EURO|nr:hypothetical protein BO71DRAFT_108300 [Aspergillus ellipticus CBS 707.79]